MMIDWAINHWTTAKEGNVEKQATRIFRLFPDLRFNSLPALLTQRSYFPSPHSRTVSIFLST